MQGLALSTRQDWQLSALVDIIWAVDQELTEFPTRFTRWVMILPGYMAAIRCNLDSIAPAITPSASKAAAPSLMGHSNFHRWNQVSLETRRPGTLPQASCLARRTLEPSAS